MQQFREKHEAALIAKPKQLCGGLATDVVVLIFNGNRIERLDRTRVADLAERFRGRSPEEKVARLETPDELRYGSLVAELA